MSIVIIVPIRNYLIGVTVLTFNIVHLSKEGLFLCFFRRKGGRDSLRDGEKKIQNQSINEWFRLSVHIITGIITTLLIDSGSGARYFRRRKTFEKLFAGVFDFWRDNETNIIVEGAARSRAREWAHRLTQSRVASIEWGEGSRARVLKVRGRKVQEKNCTHKYSKVSLKWKLALQTGWLVLMFCAEYAKTREVFWKFNGKLVKLIERGRDL